MKRQFIEMFRMPRSPLGHPRLHEALPSIWPGFFFDLIGQLEVLQPNTMQARLRRSEKFRTEEMRSGARSSVVLQGFAHLVYERIPREGLLKEETVLQEVFVPSLVFQVA